MRVLVENGVFKCALSPSREPVPLRLRIVGSTRPPKWVHLGNWAAGGYRQGSYDDLQCSVFTVLSD